MPLPTNYDISTYKGDTFTIAFTMVDEAGDPIDFTGFIFKMQIRDAENVLILEILDDAGLSLWLNTVTVSFLVNFEAGDYKYDLEATTGSVTRTYVAGTFEVIGDVTYDE